MAPQLTEIDKFVSCTAKGSTQINLLESKQSHLLDRIMALETHMEGQNPPQSLLLYGWLLEELVFNS